MNLFMNKRPPPSRLQWYPQRYGGCGAGDSSLHPFLSPSLWEPPHPLSAPCSELCLEGPEISPSLGGRGKFPTLSCPLNRKTEPQFLNHRGRHLCLPPWQAHAAPSMTHPAAGRDYGANYVKYHNLLRLVPGTRAHGGECADPSVSF